MFKAISNWRRRHRNPTNFYLHAIGIPACFVAAPLLLILEAVWLAVALFVAGYALQFIGHLVEGNRSGEELLLAKVLANLRRRPKRRW